MSNLVDTVYTSVLREDQIRLLQINSVAELPQGLVLCTLTPPLSRAEAGYYIALSYCWGDDECISGQLSINGKLFNAQPNLLDALRHIYRFCQDNDFNISSTYVWVDFICINQDKEHQEEKTTQIPRMNEVYSGAAKVIVWLGQGLEHSDLALSVLRDLELNWETADSLSRLERFPSLSDVFQGVEVRPGVFECKIDLWIKWQEQLSRLYEHRQQMEQDYHVTDSQLRSLADFLKDLSDLGPQHKIFQVSKGRAHDLAKYIQKSRERMDLFPRNHDFWAGFLGLFKLPWFSRVWTLQELILAKEAIVLCGEKAVRWHSIKVVQSILLTQKFATLLYDVSRVFEDRNELLHVIYQLSWQPPPDDQWTFSKCLVATYSRKTRRPEDNVFGILGLVPPRIRNQIQVNYEIGCATVYQNATRVAVSGYSSDVLCYLWDQFGSSSQVIVGLPSWCPDYSQFTTSRLDRKTDNGKFLFPPWKGTPAGIVRCEHGTNNLVLYGLCVAKVKASSTMCVNLFRYSSIQNPKSILQYMPEILEWHKQVNEIFLSPNPLTDHGHMFLENLFEKNKWQSHRQRVELFKAQTYLCEKLVGRSNVTGLENDPVINTQGFGVSDLLQNLIEIIALHNEIYFFLTKCGQIGYAAKPLQKGQQICFIPGGRLLYVLSNDCKRYFTTASVEGLMTYKAMGYKSFGRRPQLEKFCLQ